MKKSVLLSALMLFVVASVFSQSSLPLVPLPAGVPYYNYSSPDNFQATKIVEAKKGNDGNWYCLVKLEALSIKNTRPGFNYYDQPSFYNGVYFLDDGAIYPTVESKRYFYSSHNHVGYSPNVPGRNEVSKYKSYNQYMPTGEKGFFVWLKANYATESQVGIVPNPGANSIPLPNYIGGDSFDIVYDIGYSYKKGFIVKDIVFGGWLVKMESRPNGMSGGTGQYLQVNLTIAKPKG